MKSDNNSPQTTGGARVKAEWQAAAEAVPLEARQAFLDAVLAGKKIGESYAIAGISFEAAMGVMGMNISRTSYTTLNREAV